MLPTHSSLSALLYRLDLEVYQDPCRPHPFLPLFSIFPTLLQIKHLSRSSASHNEMLVSAVLLAVVAVLPSLALAGPVAKRYTNQVIRSGRTGTCLTLQGGVQTVDGSLLGVGDCATATKWDINPGSGSVIVSGSNFALDAGLNPHNNVPAKVWTSLSGSPQQTWYLTSDNRIAITGGNQCLDQGDNGPQTYQCTAGNTNQVWYVGGSSTPTSTSSSSSASSTPSGPARSGSQIQWKSNSDLCLTVQGTPANGTPVNMANCMNPYSPSGAPQLFNVGKNGAIQLVGSNYCLDAGTNPTNGVQMKLWQCYNGVAQQTWNFSDGTTGLAQTANNQCLDIDSSKSVKLQTWQCSSPDPQQQFVIQQQFVVG